MCSNATWQEQAVTTVQDFLQFSTEVAKPILKIYYKEVDSWKKREIRVEKENSKFLNLHTLTFKLDSGYDVLHK